MLNDIFSVEEKVRRCIARHPDWNCKRVMHSTSARKAIIEKVKAELSGTLKTPEAKDSGVISLEKVRARYDTVSAIERELALLEKGKFMAETELAQRACGSDRSRFRRAVENNEDLFKTRRAKLKLDDSGAKWWWAHQEDIAVAISWRDS